MPLAVRSVSASLAVVMFHYNGKSLGKSIVLTANFGLLSSKDLTAHQEQAHEGVHLAYAQELLDIGFESMKFTAEVYCPKIT